MAGNIDQSPPISLERKLKDKAYDPVVVIFDRPLDGFVVTDCKRFHRLDHRQTNKLDVFVGRVLLQPLSNTFWPEDIAKTVKIDLFTNIEEVQNQDLALQNCFLHRFPVMQRS